MTFPRQRGGYWTRLTALLLVLFFSLLLGSCSSDSNLANDSSLAAPFASNSTRGRVAPQPPSIVVTSPTGAKGFTAKVNSISLSGFASTDVTAVTWTSSFGRSGTASGAQSWTASDIPLSPGDNTISFQGMTLTGATASTTRTITLNPTLATLSPLTLSPDYLFVNEPADVTFSIALENSPRLDKSSVQLIQVDSNNQVMKNLGSLTDQSGGNFTFSGQFSLSASLTGNLFYRVIATSGGQAVSSEVVTVFVTTHLSEAELTMLDTVPRQALQVYNAALHKGQSPQSAQAEALTFLFNSPDVKDAGPSSDGGFGIWIVFNDDLLSCLMLNPVGTKGGAPSPLNRLRNAPFSSQLPAERPAHTPTPAPSLGALAKALTDGTVVPDLSRALLSAAFPFTVDETPNIGDLLQNATPVPYTANFVNGAGVTVDLWRSFDQYGVVYLSSHGDTFFDSDTARDRTRPAYDSLHKDVPGAQVVIQTGQIAAKPFSPILEADLRANRLCILPTKEHGNLYGILPSFITHEYANSHRMRDTLVSISACRSTFNDSLADAFLGAGAKTYTGYSETVNDGFAGSSGTEFYTRLLTKKHVDGTAFTTGDAFIPGLTDPNLGGAVRFDMRGADNLVLEQSLHLVIQPQPPASSRANSAFSLGVSIQDGSEAIVADASNPITLALKANPGGGTLSGTLTLQAVHGTVTFADLAIDKPSGGYTLVASTTKIGKATVANATSRPFSINGITLSPADQGISSDQTVTFMATLISPSPASTLTYHWHVGGSTGGTLADGINHTGAKDFDSTSPTVTYTAPSTATANSTDLVSVSVSAAPAGGGPSLELGTGTTTLTFGAKHTYLLSGGPDGLQSSKAAGVYIDDICYVSLNGQLIGTFVRPWQISFDAAPGDVIGIIATDDFGVGHGLGRVVLYNETAGTSQLITPGTGTWIQDGSSGSTVPFINISVPITID